MSTINEGIQGAKRATWDKDDPRPIAMQLISAHPRLSEAECFELFWSELLESEELTKAINDEAPSLKSMARYWFHSVWMASHVRLPYGGTRRRKPMETTEHIRSGLKTRVQYEAGLMLLDLVMPNDKPLGDCSKDDLLRFGGWFSKLAAKVPVNKTVSDVLTEDQVRKIWKSIRIKK